MVAGKGVHTYWRADKGGRWQKQIVLSLGLEKRCQLEYSSDEKGKQYKPEPLVHVSSLYKPANVNKASPNFTFLFNFAIFEHFWLINISMYIW